VSSKHCTIRYDTSTRVIHVDDHSTNGTYIDGAKIGKGNTMQVVAGQTISLGQVAQPNQDNVPHYRFALIDPVGPAQQVTDTKFTGYPDRTDETVNSPELSKLAKLANLAKLAKKNREATEAREKDSKVRRARIEK
jgi:pSer/pThr/pTyr-binding forkhead associated (FHA) protein